VASTKTTVRVEGLAELSKALKELPKATSTNVLMRTLKRTGEPMRADAEARAPRSDVEKKVHLQDTVAVSKLSKRQRKQSKKESKVEVYVGPAALAQATAQEFGTFKDRPQPYMRPAWDGNQRGMLESIKTDLAAEIEKARARLARKAERLAAKMKAGA
jgi:HK97 gp10 family phage protein